VLTLPGSEPEQVAVVATDRPCCDNHRIQSIPAPESPAAVTDIDVQSDGDLVIADGVANRLWVLDGAKGLRELTPSAPFGSPVAIASLVRRTTAGCSAHVDDLKRSSLTLSPSRVRAP
jgi:hypothetical protein